MNEVCPGNHERTVVADYVFKCGCGQSRVLKTMPVPMFCRECAAKDGTCWTCAQRIPT